MITKLWSAFRPHLIALIGFIAMLIIAFQPMFFEGKVMNQHDIQQAQATTSQLREFEEATGDPALWMFNIFSGMPKYLNSLTFKGDFLNNVQQVLHANLPRPAQIIFLTCLSFYVMLITFKIRPWIAFIGAIFFAFNGFNIIGIMAGHNAKIQAVAYIPLVISGVHLAFSGKRLLGGALLGMALGLNIHANHLQMTYYLFLIILVYGLVRLIDAIQAKNLPAFGKTVGVLLIGVLLAVGANFGKLWTTLEYSQYSTRGKDELSESKSKTGLDKSYAFQYNNGIYEPLVMFFPNILGGSSTNSLGRKSQVGEALSKAGYSGKQLDQQLQSVPTYWGEQPLTAPYYLGSMLLFLLILGITYTNQREKQWLIPLIIIGVVLSWGSNFSSLNDLIFDYLPGYNKFRSVTFTILIAMVAVVLLSGLGLERFLSDTTVDRTKKLFTSAAIAFGFAVFLLLVSAFLDYKGAIDDRINADWFVAALRADRASLFRQDIWRMIILVGLFVGLLWAWTKGKVKNAVFIGGLVVLSLFDSIGLTKRFLNQDTFVSKTANTIYTPTAADQYISSQANSGERVFNLQNPFNEAATSYLNESIGGYHGAKLGRYQDLIERHLSPELSKLINRLQNNQRSFNNLNAVNMLNAKFIKFGSNQNQVLINNNALGQAWVVNELFPVTSADEEIDALGTINPANTAVINTEQFSSRNDLTGSGNIVLTEKTPNKLSYSANIQDGNALGVFSEIYYPEGWIATIDGNPSPIIRVNYVLRALYLPEGKSKIAFEFAPESYWIGAKVTVVFNVLLILIFLGVIGLEVKKFLSEENG